MKEYLHLFTPVSEANMEFPELYLVQLRSGGFTFGWFQGGWIAGEGGRTLDVTHVLDLSKLTTKERALEFALLAERWHTGYDPANPAFKESVNMLRDSDNSPL